MSDTKTEIWFYHLERSTLDQVLPGLLEKTLQKGWRALVRAGDSGTADDLDEMLWAYRPDSFLPHAEAGGAHDADQPVLIAPAVEAANGARFVALADGVWRDEALGFDRALHFFDGDSVEAARLAWKGLSDRDGVERRYWKQDERGRWQQAG